MDKEKENCPQYRTLKNLPLHNINVVRPNVKTYESDSPINLRKESVSPVVILDEESTDENKSLDSSQSNADTQKPTMADQNLNEKLNSKPEKKNDDVAMMNKDKDDMEQLSNDVIVGSEKMCLVTKKEYSLVQYAKTHKLTQNMISRIMTGLRVFEALIFRPKDDCNNNKQYNMTIETINLIDDDDMETNELINKLLDQSAQNKALINQFYGALMAQKNKEAETDNNKTQTPNIEKMLDVSKVINQVLVNPDDETEDPTSKISNINQPLLIERAEKGVPLPSFSPISEQCASDAASNSTDLELQQQEPPDLPPANKNVSLPHYKQFTPQILHQQSAEIIQQIQQQQYQFQYMQENQAAVNGNQQNKQQMPYRPDMQAATYPGSEYANNGLMMSALQIPSSAVQQQSFAATPWNPAYPGRAGENNFTTGQCFYQQAPRAIAPSAPGYPALPVPAISSNTQRLMEYRWQQQSVSKPPQRGRRVKNTPTRTAHAPYVRPPAVNDRRLPPQLTPYQQLLMMEQQKKIQALEMEQQKKGQAMDMGQQENLQRLEVQQRSWEIPAPTYPNNPWAQAAANNRRNHQSD